MLRAVTENVLLEVQKTLEFFKATASVDHIDRVVLSGGVSRIEGLRERAAGAAAGAGRALRSVQGREVGRQEAGRHVEPALSATAAVAVGLALQAGRRPMIRINLLGGERQKAKAPSASTSASS